MINLPKLKNQQGFTLIELLVVVLVISALSGVVVSMINSGGFRDKANDAQRVADIKQTQTALELYFSDFRAYPNNNAWVQVNGASYLNTALVSTYINNMPVDPDGEAGGNTDSCFTPDFGRYNYYSPTGGATYMLTSIMAVTSSNEGNECALLSGWCPGGNDTADYCYGVENP